MTSLLNLLRFVGEIGLAVLGGWLISFTLIGCFVTLRPSSPEYGPDFEGLFTMWVARILSVVIALRWMFPPRFEARTEEPVTGLAHFTQPFERWFFVFCAVVLLGLTIGIPLFKRYDVIEPAFGGKQCRVRISGSSNYFWPIGDLIR